MTSGTHNRRIHYFSQHWLANALPNNGTFPEVEFDVTL